MKKVLAICLVMAMVLSLGLNAFAAPNGFVSSPSGNPAPTIVSFEPSDEECTARLVITPYGDRAELSEVLRNLLEKARDSVVDAEDLTKLNADLAKIAKDKKIDAGNLAVSDLFDIHVTGCDFHDGHVDFDITLDADTLSHFVGLLHMKKEGEWELIKDAKVVNNGEHLQFSVETLSPFAIVVDTTKDVPATGDNTNLYVYAAIMALSALAIVAIAVKSRKQKA